MKQLDIRQSQLIMLGIAKELTSVCNRHGIPCFMIGGTFLGAIRHKGFIPWDDDMDFGVPIEYYSILLHYLKSELKSPYRLCTYKTVKGCGTVYAKIDDPTTCIMDKCQNIPLKDQLGINIDLFPLFHCNGNDMVIQKLQKLQMINRLIFTESTTGQKYKHVLKWFLRKIFPYDREWLLDKIYETSTLIQGDIYMVNLFGVAGLKEFITNDIWGIGTKYVFEDTFFVGPSKYDAYLKQIYGNYMQLPPPEKRISHCSQVFVRDTDD